MPPDRQRLDQGPRNSSRESARCTSVVSRCLEHDTCESKILFGSTSILRENTLGEARPPISLPLPQASREDLQLDGYLEYPHVIRTLYVNKH
ncbi:hypothetical protein TNCV_117681 [Trichonephila clavipes]|nr:hypothetical protein TNCV_117681 [Trichonephila clavipes]